MYVYSHDRRREIRVDTIVELRTVKLNRPDCYRLEAYLDYNADNGKKARVILLNEQPLDIVKALACDIKEAQEGTSG